MEFASVVNQLSESIAPFKSKMGLILDLNPLWLLASRLHDAGLDTDFFHPEFRFWNMLPLSILGPDSGEKLPQLTRKFDFVEYMTSRLRRKSVSSGFQPFLLRIITRPYSDMDDSESLLNFARDTPILTVVETHGIPKLITGPGSRLISPSGLWGTLGGYLKDQNCGDVFAVTCGHVITESARNKAGQQIGTVTYRADPVPLPSNTMCHSGCGEITELDIALIRTTTPTQNQVSNIAQVVGNGQIVEMKGAKSGLRTYEIGGAVVDYEIGGACWKNLIQLHARLSGILPASVQVALSNPPKRGDSGAWIIRNDSEWTGMVVASNALFGFALSASDIVQKANSLFNTNLGLP